MKRNIQIIVAAALALLYGAAARADQFTISLDTSSLSGVQTLGFALTDGDSTPGNNMLTLSDFAFGGGSAIPGTDDCTLGGAFSGIGCSGALDTGVMLQDNDFQSFFTEQFNTGSSLSFTLITTNNFAGAFPDQLAMYVCDAGFTTCYSDDTSTAAMLTLDLTGQPLAPASFTLNSATAQNLPAPVVVGIASVPEPSSLLLIGSGLLTAASRLRKKQC